jgi:hypothetical protein
MLFTACLVFNFIFFGAACLVFYFLFLRRSLHGFLFPFSWVQPAFLVFVGTFSPATLKIFYGTWYKTDICFRIPCVQRSSLSA